MALIIKTDNYATLHNAPTVDGRSRRPLTSAVWTATTKELQLEFNQPSNEVFAFKVRSSERALLQNCLSAGIENCSGTAVTLATPEDRIDRCDDAEVYFYGEVVDGLPRLTLQLFVKGSVLRTTYLEEEEASELLKFLQDNPQLCADIVTEPLPGAPLFGLQIMP